MTGAQYASWEVNLLERLILTKLQFRAMTRWHFKLLAAFVLTSGNMVHSQTGAVTGYAYCADKENEHSVPVFAGPCSDRVVEDLACGQKVIVTGIWGKRLSLFVRPGASRSIDANAISQKMDEFVALDFPPSAAPDCKAMERDLANNHAPHVISSPEPAYPARKTSVRDGTVVLRLTVGVDGRPHDLTVIVPLDPDFDKNALNAVKKWRFEPARSDGHPIEMSIVIEVGFHRVN
jgi:TonB family protein